MAGSRLGGILQFSINGDARSIKGEFTYMTSGFSKEAQTAQGQDPVAGFSRRPRIGKITGTFFLADGLKPEDVEGIENAKAQLRLYNGRVVHGNPVTQTGDIEHDADEATFQLVLEGTVFVK